MDKQEKHLIQLLSGELPLDRVGPKLRHAIRRALKSKDLPRLRLLGQMAAAELTRQGILLKVAVQGLPAENTHFAVIRGQNQLLDLGSLGSNLVMGDNPSRGPVWADPALPGDPTASPGELEDVSGFLGAMEEAQDLEISDLQSAEKGVILASIMKLVQKFTPQFDLFLLLDNGEQVPDGQEFVKALTREESASGWICLREKGHSVWIPSPSELPKTLRDLAGAEQSRFRRGPEQSWHSGVAVPIWEPDWKTENSGDMQEAGLLFLVGYDDWGRNSLLKLAARLARFVTHRWRHQREVNQKIHTDALTGVFNRAFFDSQFTLELERARRSEAPLTLAIADIDHFKAVNDTYGHQNGDLVLKMVARRLQEELRRIDHVCRIGGEEFALILPDTSLEAGKDVLTRLLGAALREKARHHERDEWLEITLSYGAVTFPDAGADAFELFRKADAMLYLSKDLGRNQCHFWSSEGDHILLTPDTDSD